MTATCPECRDGLTSHEDVRLDHYNECVACGHDYTDQLPTEVWSRDGLVGYAYPEDCRD